VVRAFKFSMVRAFSFMPSATDGRVF